MPKPTTRPWVAQIGPKLPMASISLGCATESMKSPKGTRKVPQPMTLREAARRVARDVKSVHGDVHALLDAGVLRKADDGRLVFPYDAVRVEFLLRAA